MYLMLHSSHTRTSRLRTAVLIACTPQPDHMNSYPVLKPTSLAPANLTQPQPAPPMPCPPHPTLPRACKIASVHVDTNIVLGRARPFRLLVRPTPRPDPVLTPTLQATTHTTWPQPRPVCSPHPTTPRFTCFYLKRLVTLPALPGRYDGTTLLSRVRRPILPWCPGA